MNKKQEIKRFAIEYMGGCCQVCGYNKCDAALHFHHLNPNEKDFNISSEYDWDKVQLELEKCILLCSNCHIEAHQSLIDHELLADLAER
jgi:5-methylcytosine-specific restriction endonuclease McrA